MTPAEERGLHLQAYRDAIAPASDRRERNLHALRQRLSVEREAARVGARASAPRSIVSRAVATSVAIAAAVLLVLWGGSAGVRAIRDGARTPMQEAPAVSDRVRPGGSVRAGTREPSRTGSPDTRSEATVPPGSEASRDSGSAAQAPSDDRETTPHRERRSSSDGGLQGSELSRAQPEADDRLRAELALVRSARAALEREDFAAVWTLTSEHATKYPQGALAHERDAWRAVAACRMGREEAADTFATFVRDHEGSPYITRVRAACETP